MLYEIMRHCRNFFPVKGGCHEGTWEISGGLISLDFLQANQYFLVEGSVFNDGVYKYGEDILRDETFDGYITALAIPDSFLNLVYEIEAYQDKHGKESVGPYSSESFGGYSYTKATNADGNAVGWKDVFQSRLNTWRKL